MSRINRYATGSNRTAVVHVDIYDVVQGLDQLDSIARMKISKVLEDMCDSMEQYMKASYPWQNRTGKAVQGLKAEVYDKPYGKNGGKTSLGIKLSHTAVNPRGYAYGKSLEFGVKNGPHLARPYPIIEPTIRLRGPVEFMKLRGVLNRP